MSNVHELVSNYGLTFVKEITDELAIAYTQHNVDYIISFMKMASKAAQEHIYDQFKELGVTIDEKGQLIHLEKRK